MIRKLIGPWGFRNYMRWVSYFLRLVPWLWFGGIGLLLAVSIFELDKRYSINTGLICALTIWPVIIGWLAINGFGIVWQFGLGSMQAVKKRRRPNVLALAWSISILAAGIVFLGGAGMILSGLLKRALAL